MLIKPRPARPGDVIGIYSPSSGIESGLETNYERGKQLLRQRGYRIREAPHTREWKSHYSSDPESKVADLLLLLEDPEVVAVLPTLGGTTAYQMLPLIPYEQVCRARKLLFGFSDNSLQTFVISGTTGLVTIHGHSDVVFGLGDLLDCEKMKTFSTGGRYTTEQFFAALEGRLPVGPVPKATDWRVLKPGRATGRLMGGNLDVLQTLYGTSFMPDLRGTIFFWEAAFVELHRVDLMLASLALTGVLSAINGMVVGRPDNLQEQFFEKKHETLDEMILRHCRPYSFPIVVGADIGHDMECCALPLGVQASMEFDTLSIEEVAYE